MNPTSIFFQAVSNMTGGLISDSTTLIIAMFTISFILMAFDKFKDVFEARASSRMSENYGLKARDVLAERGLYEKGSHSYDLANAEYKALINKSIRAKMRD